MTLKHSLLQLTLLTTALLLALTLNYAFAALWVGPTGTAPTNNVAAPLNTSTTNQVKDANLSIGHSANTATDYGLISYGRIRSTIGGIEFPDGTVQTSAGATPSGMYAPFKGPTCPSGWLVADGTNGTADLRGQFVRGWSNGSTTDSGRTVGSAQGDAMRNITGTIGPIDGVYTGVFAPGSQVGYGGTLNSQGPRYWAKFDASTVVPTASENRPTNIALLYCYKT